MRKLFLALVLTGILLGNSAPAFPIGVIDTDRFGYTGVIRQYATEADARNGVNLIQEWPIATYDPYTFEVGDNRDLSLEIVNGYSGINPAYPNLNLIGNPWMYTTSDNTNGREKDDPDGDRYYTGWSNFYGNAGMFMQIRDADSSTDTGLDMAFQNFDGTYWTEFALSISGSGAYFYPTNQGDFARIRIQDVPGTQELYSDFGSYLEYSLTLTAGGLQGVANNGWIEAFNHPTSVTGTFSGLFRNDIVGPPELYYYHVDTESFWTFDLELNMLNWAYAQGDEALNGDFQDSYFAAPVPEPATVALLALGGGFLLWLRRRRD